MAQNENAFSLVHILKCQPQNNEMMHIPKLHIKVQTLFKWHELTFSHRKGQTKGQIQLKSTQKRRNCAFKSNVNSHDNQNIAMLFYA